MKSFIKKLMFGKGEVYPTIKSVKPNLTKTVKETKSDEFLKRINLLNKAQDKLKTGKEMMKEAQKARKNLVDTGRAFQFKHSKSFHAVNPGDKTKYLSSIKQPPPPKKFKKGKELAKGGRVGLKRGGSLMTKKSNIQKIKETFGPRQSQAKNLKTVDKNKNPGLAKLPIEVRNKMGYAAKGGRAMLKKGSKFPDLNKDGKITKADILMGRGVIKKNKKKVI